MTVMVLAIAGAELGSTEVVTVLVTTCRRVLEIVKVGDAEAVDAEETAVDETTDKVERADDEEIADAEESVAEETLEELAVGDTTALEEEVDTLAA